MNEVILTEHELISCKLIGMLRQHANITANIIDRKHDTRESIDISIDGVIGEYAFSKWQNVHMSLCTSPRSGSFDFLVKTTRVDIKCTRFQSGHLVAGLRVNPDVDLYVLAILEKNKVLFPGWLRKEDLIKDENIKDLGRGRCYAVPSQNLKPWPKVSENPAE